MFNRLMNLSDFIKSREKMSRENLKVLCVLYDDPEDKFPPNYARTDIPKISGYPDGQSTPTPEKIDFNP